jgi:hypothetical protein
LVLQWGWFPFFVELWTNEMFYIGIWSIHTNFMKETIIPKKKLWFAMSSYRIIGSFFSGEMVNSDCHLAILCNMFIPQLTLTGFWISTQWFMQDGARPHTTNIILVFMHEAFCPWVMSQYVPEPRNYGQAWLCLSPDINPCDLFLLGFVTNCRPIQGNLVH